MRRPFSDSASGFARLGLFVLLAALAAGCHCGGEPTQNFGSRSMAEGMAPAPDDAPELSAAELVADVDALCRPPNGWAPEPLKQSAKHSHQIWLSPSRRTAYGVIRVALPIPMGTDLALWGFLREMKKSEGRADLISRITDPRLPGIRFVAEGGLYTVRANLLTHGWSAWAVYAGTEQNQPVVPAELELAELAREHTRVGMK